MADRPGQRVSWSEFRHAVPELAGAGQKLLSRKRPHVGWAFIATLRKDGAPRLHPVSVVQAQDRLYVIIPHSSPKCADLLRDGRYALQAFPPPEDEPGRNSTWQGWLNGSRTWRYARRSWMRRGCG